MAEHNELGKFGEIQAQEYLISNGYKIRHTNWKSRKNELDIVAEKNNILVIIEVKTRSNDFFGLPEEFITNAKIKRIVAATQHYIEIYKINYETRFDIISVLKIPNETYKIEHIENAFIAT